GFRPISVALPEGRLTCCWFDSPRHMSNTTFRPGGLILCGRSISAFQGGDIGHLLRRLSIVISCSVGGSEAYWITVIMLNSVVRSVSLKQTRYELRSRFGPAPGLVITM